MRMTFPWNRKNTARSAVSDVGIRSTEREFDIALPSKASPSTPSAHEARWWYCSNPDCDEYDGEPVSSQFENEKCPSCGEPLTLIGSLEEFPDERTPE